VAVVGAGWAGLAAAWELLRHGAEVQIWERRPRAGGRAFSFPDPDGGPPLDNGQHVLLGCCLRFTALLRELGAGGAVRFQRRLHVPVWHRGRRATLISAPLPGALHLLPALLAYRHLRPGERVAALRAAAALGANAADGEAFAAWLTRHGQGPRAVASLWDLVGVGVLTCPAARASAAQACAALRMGFAAGGRQAALGFFTQPLGAVADQALAALRRAGAGVHLGDRVTGLEVRDGRLQAVRTRQGQLPVDAAVVAVPHDALAPLLPPGWRGHPTFRGAAALTWSPILDVHLRFDRPVLQGDLAAFVDQDLQFVFNRGRLLGDREGDGSSLALSLSDAEGLRGQPPDTLARGLAERLRTALPTAAGARLLRALPVWQGQATFRAAPGTAGMRPGPQSPIHGLWLAGDWTASGWPACLEGAVRSGEAAARGVAAEQGLGAR
jgi:squalene-associated FAD-dependent desaturase